MELQEVLVAGRALGLVLHTFVRNSTGRVTPTSKGEDWAEKQFPEVSFSL